MAPLVLASLGVLQQQPVLNADSLYDLHDSADRVKLRMDLTPGQLASLEEALDVMVGDRARRLIEKIEKSPRPLPAAVRLAAEARVLAPVAGLTYDGVVTAAVEKSRDRRTGLLGDLRAGKAAAAKSRMQLQKIEVVRASYWRSVASSDRSVDITILNGSSESLSGVLLDCRLIDTTRRQTRERGTCRVDFATSLGPGLTATAAAPVGWETRQRLGWVIEAKPIRAYGTGGNPLWEVASELDPAQAGPVAEIESRLAEVDRDLESLRGDRRASR